MGYQFIDTVPEITCQAYFGYSGVSRDSLNYSDSTSFSENTIQFYDYSIGNPNQWSWNFGDGDGSSEQYPIHQYADTGSYLVTLSIASEDCSNSFTSMVYVGTQPYDTTPDWQCQASFWYQTVMQSDSIYSDSSTQSSTNMVYFYDYSMGNPNQWSWEFGDGQTSTEQNPVHVYAEPGNYLVNLSINTATCQSSYTSLIFVGTIPYDSTITIDFRAMFFPVINDNNTVTFINQSTGNITGYEWDFGDGYTSTEVNPVHTYLEAGDYLVSLQANFYDTVSAVFEMMIGVGYIGTDSTPNALFMPIFKGTEVTFIEVSQNNIINRNWNFGDGNTSVAPNPTNIYPDLGIYTVTLKASGTKALETSFSMEIDLANQTYTGFFNDSGATDIVADPTDEMGVAVYPNPVNETANLTFQSNDNGQYNIFIYNITGQVLYQNIYKAIKGENLLEINTSEFEKGVYILQLSSPSKQTKSLLINK